MPIMLTTTKDSFTTKGNLIAFIMFLLNINVVNVFVIDFKINYLFIKKIRTVKSPDFLFIIN